MPLTNESHPVWRFLVIATSALAGITTSVCGWEFKRLSDVEDRSYANASRIATLEATYVDQKDDAVRNAEIWKEVAKIDQAVAKIPTDYPPKWLIDRMDKMDQRQERVEDKIDKITATLQEQGHK